MMGVDMYAGLFIGCPTRWRSTTVSFLRFGIYGHFSVGPLPPHPVHHNSKHRLVLCRVRRWHAAFPVLLIRHFEHLPALQLSIQPGADEERAAHLTVERVCLLRGRGEPVFEHHGDEVVDPLGGGLGTEVEGHRGGKSLAEDHHCIHVGIHHCLDNTRKKTKNKRTKKFNKPKHMLNTHYVCALLQLSFTCLWLLHSDKAIICKAEQAEKAQRSLPWTRNRSGTSSR